MKKIFITAFAVLAALQFSFAQSQWITSGANINNTNTGNVGIGTTSPSSKLDVQNGNINTSGSIYIGNNNSGLTNRIYLAGIDNYHYLYSSGSNGNNMYFGEWMNGGSQGFHWINSRDGSEVMTIDGWGNLAIGTTDAKGYRLAVNGSAIATSMKVKLNANWPDFVFLKDYKLPTLTEVKTYIDKNQHLPDMPSADEVQKNGLDLGEMNRLLLKKVEELTLYLMEEHDKNVKQEARIKTLEANCKAGQ